MARYRGMNFGGGLTDFSNIIAEGYKAQRDLERWEKEMAMKNAQRKFENLYKAHAVDSEYGPPGGRYLDPRHVRPINVTQALMQGSDLGRKVRPGVQAVDPFGVADLYRESVSGGEKDAPSAEKQPAKNPEAATASKSPDRKPQGGPPVEAAGPNETPEQEAERIRQLNYLRQIGAEILPDGRIIVPNYMANSLAKDYRAGLAAEAAALREGYRGGSEPPRYITPPAPRSSGRSSAPKKDKTIQFLYQQTVNQIRDLNKKIAPSGQDQLKLMRLEEQKRELEQKLLDDRRAPQSIGGINRMDPRANPAVQSPDANSGATGSWDSGAGKKGYSASQNKTYVFGAQGELLRVEDGDTR